MESICKTQYNFIKQLTKHNFDGIEIVQGVPKVVYICWFGHKKDFTPGFTVRRYKALLSLVESLKVPVIMLTWDNYKSFEVKSSPMHPGFEYLSGNHKSDYLRAYMLYHYGGGYHDIKYRELSWDKEWDKFVNPNVWIIGRRELKPDCIGFPPGEEWIQQEYKKLITMSWVISRPKTKYLDDLLNEINVRLDSNLDNLLTNPAFQSRQSEQTNMESQNYLYPFRWLELMGEIFHKLLLSYTDYIDYTLPDIIYKTYK